MSYLVCEVTFDATKHCMKLQHEDQLQLGLWLLPFNPLQGLIPRPLGRASHKSS